MFEDRVDAGNKLCLKLKKFSENEENLVVGLTRGGVVTAKVIADFLKLKLKALIVKKIPLPQNEELAIGATTFLKIVCWNQDLIKEFKISEVLKEELVLEKQQEINELAKTLKIKERTSDYKNMNAILVDDGVATGASCLAALNYLKKQGAKKIFLATPVISYDTLINIKRYFDNVFYLKKEIDFYAVGQFYKNFEQISNEEVAKILNT